MRRLAPAARPDGRGRTELRSGNSSSALIRDLYVEYLDGQSYLTFYTLTSMTRTNAGPWYPKAGEVYVRFDKLTMYLGYGVQWAS